MRKKAEHETARLLDFDFRRRVRATRLFLIEHGLDEAATPELVAHHGEAAACERLAELAGMTVAAALADYARLSSVAHAQLVAERGDPTPHRLA